MRTAGVEIEFSGDMGRALQCLRAAGLDAQDSRHTHDTGDAPSGWAIKRDGSIRHGGELTSPVLNFDSESDRADFYKAVEALQAANVTTDSSAGIHVHIGATNADGTPFTGKQIAAVVRFCYKFEDAIYRVASSGWRSLRPGATNYAKPIPESVARAIMSARTIQDVKDVWDGNIRQSRYGFYAPNLDRYTALNLRSYWSRKTIEFRFFNSSLNPTRIWTYIALCNAIMEDARMGHSRQVATNYPIGSMYEGRVKESALLLRLQQVLTQDDKDTHRLMSKEDWKNFRKLLWNGSVPQRNLFI